MWTFGLLNHIIYVIRSYIICRDWKNMLFKKKAYFEQNMLFYYRNMLFIYQNMHLFLKKNYNRLLYAKNTKKNIFISSLIICHYMIL